MSAPANPFDVPLRVAETILELDLGNASADSIREHTGVSNDALVALLSHPVYRRTYDRVKADRAAGLWR